MPNGGCKKVPNDPKIVVLGAGSASFSLNTLFKLLKTRDFDNGTLYMVDIDEKKLKIVSTLAKRIKLEFGSRMELFSTTDRLKALSEANFVILVIGIDRDNTWQMDYELGKKFGIYHYAENGGPGSFGHTARNLAVLMPIFKDIQDLAPNSWIINFTNPLPRIHYAIKEYTKLKCVSFCHQYWHGHYIIGRIMLPDLKKRFSTKNLSDYKLIRNASLQEYDVLAAGLNHFSFMLDFRRNLTNEDIYPLFRRYVKNVPKKFESLTIHMFKVFKLLPISGETHISEYLPYTHLKQNWDKYHLVKFNFEENKINRIKNFQKIQSLISGNLPLNHLQPERSERLADIIYEIYMNTNSLEPALNIENNGCIRNLPEDAIVEVPCFLNRYGASGMNIGRLPESIAALCNREISIAKLITQGSVSGDREKIIQAFALEPMVNDLNLAEKLVDTYLDTFEPFLPQFFDKDID
jgi:alpha-galactosidase